MRAVKVADGTQLRIRVLRWDEGWEFDCPTVIISPVLRVYEDGRSIEEAIEDLLIDARIEGELRDRERETWRWDGAKGGGLAYLRRKYYRPNVQRADVRVRFCLDEEKLPGRPAAVKRPWKQEAARP